MPSRILDDKDIFDTTILDWFKVNTWAWAWDVMPGKYVPGPSVGGGSGHDTMPGP